MKHVVLYSGGLNSWGVAVWVVEFAQPDDEIVLLFTDTTIEDPDVYRFIDETAADFGSVVELVVLKDGRDPWQVFHDERIIGNTRLDPCSKLLKRRPTRRWVSNNCDPGEWKTCIYIGFGWDEDHRYQRSRSKWTPYRLMAPLIRPPYLTKQDLIAMCRARGIEPPDMYARGYPHANCGGFCVKAGQAHFAHLLTENPELYAHHEAKEQEMREYLARDVAILRDRRGGSSKPLTMRALRERIEADATQIDMFDWGGCGCFFEAE